MSQDAIIVASDLTEDSLSTARRGAAWAAERGAKLVIVHVVADSVRHHALFPQRQLGDSLASATVKQAAGEALAQFAAEALGPTHEAQLRLEYGGVAERVLTVATETEASGIAVGSPRLGVSRWILGASADRIIRHATCPVLVVRTEGAPKSVVAATDFSDAALPAVRTAHAIARVANARLTVVHVVASPRVTTNAWMHGSATDAVVMESELSRESQKRLEGIASDLGPPTKARMVHGDPAEGVLEAAAQAEADLLVVGTRGHTGLQRLLIGSVAERIVHHATCSVLVVRLG